MKTLMCDPKLFEKDLTGKVYIVTGANSGSGYATTAQLVKQGAHVVGACRRVDAGKEAFAALTNEPGSTEVMHLDLASLDSVRNFAEEFKIKHSRLDGLVNNAGVMASPEAYTKEGFGLQFGVNYLGHFLLTELLLDLLKAGAPSRIILVSSVAHNGMGRTVPKIHFEDLDFSRRDYNATNAYEESKLAIVLNALDLSRRLQGTGVTAVSVHPGWIRSNLVQHSAPPWVQNVLMRPFSRPLGMMSWDEGAQTTLHCLLDDEVPNHEGEYYSQNSIFYKTRETRKGSWPMVSPNPQGTDRKLAKKLYEATKPLVKLG